MIGLAFIMQAFAFLFVVAVSFAVITLLASLIRFHLLTQRVAQADATDVDPQDLFQLRVMQELGAFHQSPEPFCVCLVEPDIPPGFEAAHGAEAVEAALQLWLAQLKTCVRSTDYVSPYQDGSYGVLGLFPLSRAEAVGQRVARAMKGTSLRAEGGLVVRWGARIGVAAHPEHGEKAGALIAQARAALDQARQQVAGAVVVHALPAPDAFPDSPGVEEKATPSDSSNLLDPLTGVLRAERFGTALQKMVAKQRSNGLGVSVVYCSIDLFRQYQDHYNQQATDTLVKGLADVLVDYTRETDVLARIDESEFALVLDAAPPAALEAAQRLVAQVKRTDRKSVV